MKKIQLSDKEVEYLSAFVKRGKKSAREITRAHILLLANGGRTENEIKEIMRTSRGTVSNVKKRYLEEGLKSALTENPRSGQPKKYTEQREAEIIAQACTNPPHGRKRWTLTLLAEEMKMKEGFETANQESIRLILKKAKISLG